LEFKRSSASIELLIDLLACLEPELWPKTSVVHKNPKTAEKAWVYRRRLCATRDDSQDAYVRELFKPSKDSCSLV